MHRQFFLLKCAIFLIFIPFTGCAESAETKQGRANLPKTTLRERLGKFSAGHHYRWFVIHFANAEYGSCFVAYTKLLESIKGAVEDDMQCPVKQELKGREIASK